MVRDVAIVVLDRDTVPEVLTLVLRPKGKLRVPPSQKFESRLGWAHLEVRWRVIELWTLSADQLLSADDVGLVPWIPLVQQDEPPRNLLVECRRRIDRQAPADEHANLLAVTQILTQLRYNDSRLLALLGGKRIMIESPLIQEIVAERMHKDILAFLESRFGRVPQDLATDLEAIHDEQTLDELVKLAARCRTLSAFHKRVRR